MKKFLLIIIICFSKLLPNYGNKPTLNNLTSHNTTINNSIPGKNLKFLTFTKYKVDSLYHSLQPYFPAIRLFVEKDTFLINNQKNYFFNDLNINSPFVSQQVAATPCCTESIVYNATNSTIPETASASTSITFDGEFELESTVDYTFNAGSEIVLNPGVSISPETGSFTANIEACAVASAGKLSAGGPLSGCEANPIPLIGTSTGTSPVKWTSNGTGKFGDATKLISSYTPSAADLLKTSVILTLSEDAAAGGCSSATPDTTTITFIKKPTIDIESGKESISTTKNVIVLNFISSLYAVEPVAVIEGSKGKATFIETTDGFTQVSLDVSSVTPAPTTPVKLKLTVGAGSCAASDSILVTFGAEEKSIVIGEPDVKDIINSCGSNTAGLPYKTTGYEGVPEFSSDDTKIILNVTPGRVTLILPKDYTPVGTIKVTGTLKGTPVITDFFSVNFTEVISDTIFNKAPIISETNSVDITYLVKGGTASWTVPAGITHVAKIPGKVETFTQTTPSSIPVDIELYVVPLGQCPSVNPIKFSVTFGSNCATPPVVQNASPLSVCSTEKTVILKGTSSIVGTSLTYKDAAGVEIPIVGGAGGGGVAEYTFTEGDRTKGVAHFTLSGSAAPNCVSEPVTFSVKLDALPEAIIAGKLKTDTSVSGQSITLPFTAKGSDTTWKVPSGITYKVTGGTVTFNQTKPSADPVKISLTVGTEPCTASDSILVTFNKAPEMDCESLKVKILTPAKSFCADSILLEGGPATGSKLEWSVISKPEVHSGNFRNNNAASTYYKLDYDEVGPITLQLKSTAPGCTADSATVVLNSLKNKIYIYHPLGSVSYEYCTNVPRYEFYAHVTPADAKVKWSTSNGAGSFSRIDSIHTWYKLTSADTTRGNLSVTIQTTNETCVSESTEIIKILPGAKVELGPDLYACKNNPTIELKAVRSGNFFSLAPQDWVGGKGKITPEVKSTNNIQYITYTPTSEELLAKSVVIQHLVGPPNEERLIAQCAGAKDSVTIHYIDSPVAVIGGKLKSDTSVSGPSITLPFTAEGSDTTWKVPSGITYKVTDGTVTFNQTKSSADPVKISLTVGTEPCAASDTITLTFSSNCATPPVVQNASPLSVCNTEKTVILKGTSTIVGTSLTFKNAAGVEIPIVGGAGGGGVAEYTFTEADRTKEAASFTISGSSGPNCLSKPVTFSVKLDAPPLGSVEGRGVLTSATNTIDVHYTVSNGTPKWVHGTEVVNTSKEDGIETFTQKVPSSTAVEVSLVVTGSPSCPPSTYKSTITFGVLKDTFSIKETTTTTCTDSVVVSYTSLGKDPVIKTNNTSYDKFLVVDKVKKTITFKPTPRPTQDVKIIGSIIDVTKPLISDSITITFAPKPIAVINEGTDTTVTGSSIELGYSATGSTIWTPTTGVASVPGKEGRITFTPATVTSVPVKLKLSAKSGTCTSADSISITFKTIGSKDSVAFAKNTYTTCADSIVIPYIASGKDPVFKTNDTSLDKFLSVNKTAKTVTFKPAKPAPVKPVLIIAGISGTTQPGISDTTTVTFSAPALALIENGKRDTTVSQTSVKLGYKVSGTATWVPATNIVRVAGKDSIVFTPNPVPVAPVKLVLKAVNGNCTSADSINITFNATGTKDTVAFAKNTYSTCADSIVIPYTSSGKDPVFKTNDTSLDKFLSVNKTAKTVIFKPAKPAPAKPILIIAGIPGATQPGTSDTTTVTFSATSTVKLKDEDSVKTVCKADTVLLPFTGSSDITWNTSAGSVKESADKKSLVFIPAASKGTAIIKGITIGSAGCVADTSTITLKYTKTLMVKAGADQSLCGSNAPVQLTGSDVTGGVAVLWTSTGTGKFDQNPNNLHPVYVPTREDQDKGTVYLVLHTAENPGCDVTDTMKVDFKGGVKLEAGEPQQLCSNVSTVDLTGVVPAGTPLIQWSALSEGATFSSPTKAVTSYTPTEEEKKKGESILIFSAGEINCQGHDTVKITYKPAPVPHGGGDRVVCKSSPVIQLNGSIDGGGQGTWNKTGTGQFVPNNESLSAKYIPSAADLEKGTLQLVLTSKPAAGCPSSSDLVNIKFIDSPTANAGTGITVCSNNSIVQLAGAVSGDSLVWRTNGGGRFSDSTSRKSQYFPSKGDIEKGSVGLTLIPKASNECIGTGKTLLVTIIGGPSVDAGSDRIICPGEASVALNGAVLPAGQGQWSVLKGTGTFQNSTALNAKYIPSDADRKSGEVTLTLSSVESAGKCLAETKNIKLRFSDSAVYAGVDQQLCIAGSDTVYLSGITAQGVTADWEGSGSGTWLNSNVKGFYKLSAEDRKKDSLIFTLTANSNTSSCNGAVKDVMLVRFSSGALVDAGKDVVTCAGKNAVLLGTIAGSTRGKWRALGDGTFKNASELTTEYLAGSEDIKKGKTSVVLSNDNKCGAGKEDTVNISFIPAPTVEAGSDQVICPEKDSIVLTGILTGEASKSNTSWSTTGTGKFTAAGSLNTAYQISQQDKTKEQFYISLSFIEGSCKSKDSLKVSFSKTALKAGPDQQACFSSPIVDLKGVSAQKAQWITLGDGHFVPGDTLLTTTYVPGSKDTSSGKVSVILRSTVKGTCSAQDDTLSIAYISAPGVSAGPNQTICPGNKVNLEGAITGNTKGTWTSEGDGAFTQKDSLKTTYTPGPKDVAAQKVILTLTSQTQGLCKSSKDTILLSITNTPKQLGEKNRKVCSSADTIHLEVPGLKLLKNISWRSLGSGSIDTTGIKPTYKFSAADKTAGTVNFTYAGQGIGQCGSGKDTLVVNLEPLAVSKATREINICANEKVKLKGTISGGASKGKWLSEGDGKFYPSDTSLNAFYKLGVADINKPSLRIFLSSVGGCNTSVDTVSVAIKSNSVVDAGGNTYVCSRVPSVNLKGKLLKGNGVKWKTLGDGLFSDNTLPNPTYTFKSGDLKAGSVKLILSTVGIPECPPSADTILVKIVDPPKVVLPNKNGEAIDICKSAIADVTGRIIGGLGTGQWTSSGRGKFISDTSLTTQYLPSTLDTTYGTAWLKLSTKGAKECGSASDSIRLTIRNFESPDISNYKNKIVCADGEVSIGNNNNPDYTYKWSPAKGLSSDSVSNPTISLKNKSLKDTTYTFNLMVTETSSGFFCTSRDTVKIKVFRPLTSNAGKDTVVCVGQKFILGEPGAKGFHYRWQGADLSDSTAPNPAFTPGPQLAGKNILFTLTSSIPGTECRGTDTVFVDVRQGPVFNAGKDTSVCSGEPIKIGTGLIKGIGNKYKWMPAAGISSDTMATPSFVATNTTPADIRKKLSVQLKSLVGCVLEDTVIITVKPRPGTSIILNDTAAFCGKPYTASYAVAGANESSYNWDVTGGIIERGQGSGSVKVNWNNSLSKELRVTQISSNGCKDTLVIPLLNSTISVIVNNVTKQAEDNKNYIYWSLKAPKAGLKEQALPKLKLKRVTVGAPNDTLTIGGILNDSLIVDNEVDPTKVYQYTFHYQSNCGIELKSISHNNISLGYDILKENNYALLKWNPYETWPKGVGNYDLWRKVDEAEYYKFETDSSNKLSATYYNDPEAVTQCFKVKAVNKDKPSIVSWSNQICVNTKLRIPNAITPNGDLINDSWIIENINLYPENEVQIFNQWHQKIYQKKGYTDDWTGEGHPDGTYYYLLKTSKSTVKGYIMIIR